MKFVIGPVGQPEQTMTDAYLMTASGTRVDLPNPLPGQVKIEDVTVHLGRIARFVGATKWIFSVAEHSLVVSYLTRALCQLENVPEYMRSMYALEGLLHDAHEAYLSDVPSPVKRLIPGWKAVELSVDAAIRREFRLAPRMPDIVHRADNIALLLEDKYLRVGHISTVPGYETTLEAMAKLENNRWYQLARDMVAFCESGERNPADEMQHEYRLLTRENGV